jgi:opacity protein-like surface antigen
MEHANGIREGRSEGSMANANNLAVLGSLQYNIGNMKYQISGYMSGTNGLAKHVADSSQLKSGVFAMPVFLGEGNVQYSNNGWNAKALVAYISLPDANKINAVYNANLSKSMYGAFAEVGYNLFHKKQKQAQLIGFARFEMLDLNAGTEEEAANYDGTLKQSHLIAGFSYLPTPNVAIKADIRLLHTGDENPLLVQNPLPNGLPYKPNNSFINIGIGYSF